MSHNPVFLLLAALQTDRPELIKVFQEQMTATIDQSGGLDADTSRHLVTVIENLFTQVYDLRRTVRTMEEAQKHVYQALQGCEKHLMLSREASTRGQAGRLPEAHSAEVILALLKAEMTED